MLTYSKKSWHYKLFTISLPFTKVPNNICAYFWYLVLAIVTLPFSLVGKILNRAFKQSTPLAIQIAFQQLIIIGFIMISVMGYAISYNKNVLIDFSIGLIALLVVLLSIVIVSFIIYCIVKYSTKAIMWLFRLRLPKLGTNLLIEGIRALKGKYCTPIKWDDDEI